MSESEKRDLFDQGSPQFTKRQCRISHFACK